MAMAIPRGMSLLKYLTGNERINATAIPDNNSLGRVGRFQKMRRISPTTMASKILRVRGETGICVSSTCISGLSRQENLRQSRDPKVRAWRCMRDATTTRAIASETMAETWSSR